MCYVHADWLNMMANENIFNNMGLGCQPKHSWINPKNDRGCVSRDVGVMLYPAAGSVVWRLSSSKSQSHHRALVQSDLPRVGWFGTTPVMKTPSWVLLKQSLLSASFFLFSFFLIFFFLFFFKPNKWKYQNQGEGVKCWWSPTPSAEMRLPYSAPTSAVGQPIPPVPIFHKLFGVLKEELCWTGLQKSNMSN